MKSSYKINMKAAATLIAVGSFASVHAAVIWDNNGGTGDNKWGTATNWDAAAPVASDIVIIDNGDTVNITGNILASNLNITLSGGSDLTYTGVGGAFQLNLKSATVALATGSTLASDGDIRMWNSASIEFDDGADLNGKTEFRGANAGLQFNLGATGFTTVTAGNLGFWSGNDLSDINFTVDLTDYTAGAATITLIDWTGGSGSQALLDGANQTITGGSGNLIWDDTNKAIQLNIAAVPEPSSAALLGLGGLALILRRRK